MIRSRVARWKYRRIERVPAGDPDDGDACECGGNYLLTEDSQIIATEGTQYMQPEDA